jgi:hypothetical protein
LSWIITLIPVDQTLRINIYLGLICLIATGFYFLIRKS